MWMKDSNGNWFMSNIDVFGKKSDNSNIWNKDIHGDWFQDKEIKTLKMAEVNRKNLIIAC